MAGERFWIRMRTDLAQDVAVINIAAATGIDEDTVVGKLHKLWSWATDQLVDGCAKGVTSVRVNRMVGAEQFAEAMAAEGWLTISAKGVTFPKWDSYLSEGSKSRASNAARVRTSRAQKSQQPAHETRTPSLSLSVSDSVPVSRGDARGETRPPVPDHFDRQHLQGIVNPHTLGGVIRAHPIQSKSVTAKAACENAILRLIADGRFKHHEEAADWLRGRLELFAGAVKGADMALVKQAPGWFDEGRYDDDPETWKLIGRAPNRQAKPDHRAVKASQEFTSAISRLRRI